MAFFKSLLLNTVVGPSGR